MQSTVDKHQNRITSYLKRTTNKMHLEKHKTKYTQVRRYKRKIKGLGKKEKVGEQLGSHPEDLRDLPSDRYPLQHRSPCNVLKYLVDRSL